MDLVAIVFLIFLLLTLVAVVLGCAIDREDLIVVGLGIFALGALWLCGGLIYCYFFAPHLL